MSTTTLYRFFDRSHCLLYVGISVEPQKRFRQHRSSKAWWPDVVRITVESHESRQSAAVAELVAIASELPMYNTAGHPAARHLRPKRPASEMTPKKLEIVFQLLGLRQFRTYMDEYGIEPAVVDGWIGRHPQLQVAP